MEINTILVGVTVTLLCYLFQKYFIKIYDYWPKRGVPYVKGALPFFGNSLPMFLFRKDLAAFATDTYDAFEKNSMVGYYQSRKPALLLRDPELVKTVLISDFANFHINQITVDADLDPLLAENPFFAYGEEWKKRRNYLTNALMSSKKLKMICNTVTKVCAKFTNHLEENMKKSKGAYEVETKELFTRFTGEVVSSVGFGVEGEFFGDDSNPNSFKANVHGIFDQTIGNVVAFTLVFLAPSLNRLLRFSFLPKHLDSFFRRVTSQVIAARRKEGIVRDDFVQLMMEAHKKSNGELDEDGVTASSTSFFIDGYETSAITLQFFAYCVAAHPEVQDKIRREVNDVLEKHGGEICYEAIVAMTYMEQALHESMRVYPALGFLAKRCSRPCRLVGNDGVECDLEAGVDIFIPIESLQKDPKYWESPEVYDPDRFSTECKNDRPKTVFLPFGEGPRVCPGMRFATMQMKAAMATLLRCCKIEVSPKMKLPLQVKHSPLKVVEGGLWITLKPL